MDVEQLFGQMVAVGAEAFGAGWGQVEKFAKVEFKTIAQRIEQIGQGLLRGDFDLTTGKMLVAMQINLATAAIAGATTLTMLAVEAAINAVLAVIKGAVNSALKMALL